MECILNQVDPLFETTHGFNYKLSVLLSVDGFSFLVTHTGSKKILKLAAYRLGNGDIHLAEKNGWPANGVLYFEQLKNTGFASLTYHKVEIAVSSYKISIAPHNFFIASNAKNMMSAVHQVSDKEEIISEPVFNNGPVIAIAIPDYIKEGCEAVFPGYELRCAPAVFVKGIMLKHSHRDERQIFINIHEGYFEITVIQGSQLVYLNAFRFLAPSDVLYYVIFVLEQLGFVPAEEKITLMGEHSVNPIISDQLKMYCASIRFPERPKGIEFGDAFSGIELQRYFTLLNIPICA